MLFRVLELCLTVIALVLTTREIILPLIWNKPLFPLVRKTLSEQKNEPKKGRN